VRRRVGFPTKENQLSFSNELLAAAERTMHAAGAKPKDVAAVLQHMNTEHAVEFAIEGGLLNITQTGTTLSAGSVLAAHRAKNPRMYFGEASGTIRFKDDLAGDNEAKSRYLSEFGYQSWADLPLNERSPGAKYAISDVIPSAGMKRSEYLKLTVAEKTKLAAEIGVEGIQRIMARTR
jgi:hypothetical protein